jgi:hypothetical protein
MVEREKLTARRTRSQGGDGRCGATRTAGSALRKDVKK